MVLSFLSRGKKRRKLGEDLYSFVRDAARNPVFFGEGKIPDSVDGRFEVLVMHGFLLMRALRQHDQIERVDQLVFDAMIRDLDGAVRELGASDTRVGRRIKSMAQAFFGRSKSYHDALETSDPAQIRDALARNVEASCKTEPKAVFLQKLSDWFLASNQQLSGQKLDVLLRDGPKFAPAKFD